MRIAECVLHETLYESNSTRVYRGRHEPSSRFVVVKQARISRTSLISRLRREYRLATGIGDTAVVEPLAFEDDIEYPGIIYADFGGVALSKILSGQRARRSGWSIPEFLDLACRLAVILQVIHANSIVHQDVKPANIIFNPETGEARITDFGIAVLSDGGIMPSLRMRGTLAYMAPEQSGRMNRAIDHRADLYSLGITLYEILTGRLPFDSSDDILEMIHRHMAVRPVDPHVVSPEVPEALSAIIMKLLAKDAEDRYQSAAGLSKDFEECRKQWRERQAISDFAPGQRDVSDVFAVSSKLYGREKEKGEMIQAFRRVVSGAREFCLIRGFAGIGKSSVAFGLQDAVLESRGYFVSGKFDQYQLGIPYSGILKAFRQLINEILKEDPEEIAVQKESLRTALGSNGRIITEVIPEIERIIGPQPEPIAVGPEEAENRFIGVFQEFVRVLARAERPLVLFIDDLHWADAASLRLLRVLLTATEIRYLMILGAYRDNEVSDTHPLAETLELLKRRNVAIRFIDVQALNSTEVNGLIAATLQANPERAAQLSDFIHQKTGGNPFFVREFLQNLHSGGHIDFDAHAASWNWDAALISSLPAPDQIGELMAHKIQHLDPATRSALQYAACVGNRFECKFLAELMELSEDEVVQRLKPALREGLLSPLLPGFDDRLRDAEATLEISGSESHYQFQHDRIQQAAYDSLPIDTRRECHLSIALEWIRLSSDSEKLLDENIFAIVHHFDAADELVFGNPENQLRAARLYLRAGKRGLDSAAYQAAAESLAAGIRLVPGDAWREYPDLIRNLYVANAEAEHLCSRNDACIGLVHTILENVADPLVRIPAYEIYLRAFTALGDIDSLISVGLDALASLGFPMPANPGAGRAFLAIHYTQAIVRWKRPESILTAPEMRDPYMLAAMRILALLASGAYKKNPNLYAVAMCKYAEITYRGGRSPATSYALVSMAVLLVSVGQAALGMRLSRIGLEMLAGKNDHGTKTLFAHAAFVSHWVEPLEKNFNVFREGRRTGMANGDIEYGAYCAAFLAVHSLYSTSTIASLQSELAPIHQLVRNFRNESALLVTGIYAQLVMNLKSGGKMSFILTGDLFDKDRGLKRLHELNFNSEINLFYSAQAFLMFLLGEHRAALNAIEISQAKKKYVRSMYFVPLGTYLEAIIRFVCLSDMDRKEAQQSRRKLKPLLREIQKWQKLNPAVYRHKWYLLLAEKARVDGKYDRAARFYNQAIETAHDRGYLLDEALACELAGEYYLAQGNRRIAQGYIEDAYRVYSQWEAQAKIKQLEEKYPEFFSEQAVHARPSRATLESTIAFATRSEAGDLDIDTVTKAVQMLFAGQNATAVMDEFLRLSVENAGAQRGALVLRRVDELWLEAVRDLTATGGDFRAQPFESYTSLPREIINYVLHTGEPVVLGNASEKGDFTADPYVRRSRCKSILAAPIVYEGDVRGVLYLENRLAANVLTRPRLQILGVLSHQAAVSLENARLYEHMQSEIGEKTRQLLNLKLARDRMDPHFLFNSLNLVQALMRKDPETANRALFVLADLYRTLTDISKEELVDFELEWRFLEEYLNLMQLRYADTLRIQVKRPAQLPRFQIPPLSLQPIVENSFKHGFQTETDVMRVEIDLNVLADRVEIVFHDSGSGFKRDIQPGDTLHSISERLKHYFTDATLRRDEPKSGSRVTVTIAGFKNESPEMGQVN